jgi:2-polyprenyl-3-methyl-5-hydroxy-6-metoxy-1,4-benzoquinol methylase
MRNLLHEKPTNFLGGRNLALMEFVDRKTIKGKMVLDVGCGFGWLEYQIMDLAKDIVGVDLDKNNIKMANHYIKRPNVSFRVANALKMPIESKSKDIIISSELIEHLPIGTEIVFFKEIFRILKNDGVFYLTTPFKSFWSILFDPAWWLIKHRHYSFEDLEEIAKKSGLRVIKYKVGGKWWSLVGLINLYVSKWVFRRKRFAKDFFNKKEKKEFSENDGWMNIFVAFKK